jgi:hypothetical protein
MKYILTPYQPNTNFTKSKGLFDTDRMGFFETHKVYDSSREAVLYSTKFDHQKGITFAISHNTPKAYKKAVKDGILYWSKAFEGDIVKVIDAPEGVSAPSSNYNIVQWIDAKNLGSAYADAQMDPRTGEVLHAQVFMAGSFATDTVEGLNSVLRRLRNQEEKKPQLILKNFESSRLCQLDYNKQFLRGFENALQLNLNDKQIKKLSEYYITYVIAHEVGHTLGLRHNFAGSHAINYDLSDRHEIMVDLMKEGKTDESYLSSSSIMEYSKFLEVIHLGQGIQNNYPVLNYDLKAINTLYYGKKYSDEEIPLFCTDDHVALFSDCQRFDIGKSLVEASIYNQEDLLKKLPYQLIEKFIKAKALEDEESSKPLAKVKLNAQTEVSNILDSQQSISAVMGAKKGLLSIHRQFPYIDESNQHLVKLMEMDYFEEEIEKRGGLDNVFPIFSSNFSKEQTQRFLDILSKNDYSEEISYEEKSLRFNSKDKKIIKNKVKLFYDYFQEHLIISNLKAFNALEYHSHKLNDKMASHHLKMAKEYLLSQKSEKESTSYIKPLTDSELSDLVKEDESLSPCEDDRLLAICEGKMGTKTKVEYSNYTYSYDIRKAASTLLTDSYSKEKGWGFVEKAELKDLLKKQITKAFNDMSFSDIDAIKKETLPKGLRKWLIINTALYYLL